MQSLTFSLGKILQMFKSVPAKTLTLTLEGKTSKETVYNRITLDTTLDDCWFILKHEIGFDCKEIPNIDERNTRNVKMATPPGPTYVGSNARIAAETLRFVDKTQNLKRLLKVLGIVQVTSQLAEPLTFVPIVGTMPTAVLAPSWFNNQGRSDLIRRGDLQSISF
jgi:hypothetical protein